MSHKEFDSNIKGAFEKMEEHESAHAMRTKEDIWESLEINAKKPIRFNGLVWFLLGLLLAIGGFFLKELIFAPKTETQVLYADNDSTKEWEVQLKKLENKIAIMSQQFEDKNSLIDSLSLQNQNLYRELQMMASIDSKITPSLSQSEYVKDTIYVTEIKEQILELEKIVRDTVFIEVPILQEGEELMTDVTNKPEQGLKKDKPRSIQFNFRKSKSEK